MHEMSLAESALQIIEQAAVANNLRRVSKVRLEIGQLMAVEPQSLRCCLELVARGSLADGAELEITEIPAYPCWRSLPPARNVATGDCSQAMAWECA